MGKIVNFYPSSSDILFEGSSVCKTCGKKLVHLELVSCENRFSNTSALRLHRIKKHHQILNDGDKTLFSRDAERDDSSSYFHCPEDVCRPNAVKFTAMRHLRQHYLRMHTTKDLACKCGTRFSLEKDRKYHKKARCPLRQEGCSSPIKPMSRNDRKRKLSDGLESSKASVLPENPTVLVILTAGGNTQETLKEILNALKVTSTVGIQTSCPEPIPTTNTASVGDASTEFCDFSGQYNAPLMETDYYYQETNPAVRDISTGTDFVQSYVSYTPEMADYGSYNYVPQPGSSSVSMQQFPNDLQPSTRTFGTTTDDFSTHVPREDFDMLRDIETQTFWESFDGNGLIENIQS